MFKFSIIKSNKKRSVLFYWIISFIIEAIILLALYSFPFAKASSIIGESTEKLAFERMSKVKQNMESYLEKLLQITWQVSESYDIRDMAYANITNNEYQVKAYLSKELLRSICKNYTLAENIYIYISKRNLLMGSYFIYNSDDYFDKFLDYDGFNKKMWKEVLSTTNQPRIISIPNEMGSQFPPIFVIKTTISFYNGEYLNIMIPIDRDLLSQDLMVGEGYDKGELLIFSEDNELLIPFNTATLGAPSTSKNSSIKTNSKTSIASNDKKFIQEVFKNINQDNELGVKSIGEINYNGQLYTLMSFTTKTAHLRVVYALPYIIMWDKLINVRTYFYVIILIGMIVSMFSGAVLSVLNYRPISRILNKYSGNKFNKRFDNEYTLLDSYISNMLDEKTHYKEIAAKNEDTIRKSFIEKILLMELKESYIENIENKSNVYSIITEQKLLMYIKSGDVESSKLIIDEIYNNVSNYLDDFDMHCLMYELGGTIIKAVKDNKCKLPESEKITIIEKLLKCKDIFTLKDELYSIIEYVCDVYVTNTIDENALYDKILLLIDQNFADPNFNVTSISDKLDMNLSYISRYFKSKNGQKIIEYITNKRISKAKELLLSSNEPAELIAEKCGFGNVRTFNRVFLSVVTITPSKYRKAGGAI